MTNPNFNFKAANPVDPATAAAVTASRRASRRAKRAKRSFDETQSEEEDSQPPTPADQSNDHSQAEDATLVNEDSEAGTGGNDQPQAPITQNNHRSHQPTGTNQADHQEQPPIGVANNRARLAARTWREQSAAMKRQQERSADIQREEALGRRRPQAP